MSYAVLLLCLVLIATATSQSTTETPTADGVSSPPKEGKESDLQFLADKNDNTTDSDEVDGEDSEEPMARSESHARFTFSQADARPWTKPPEVDDDVEEGDDDEIAEKLLEELTSFVDTGVKLMDNASNDSDTSIIKIKEQDNGSEEDGEEDIVPSDADEQIAGSKPEESQIKRQDESNPFNQNKASGLDFDQPNRRGEIPAPPREVYVTVNDEPDTSNPENDNSPLLQLTQGGYRSPYIFNTENPRIRAHSASQQSETLEDPTSIVNNDEQFRQPQISPQVSYADPFQSQFGFGSALGLRHPFIPPDSFVNSNGMVHQPVQNGFFNVPPAGFTDFTGANFQAPFSPSNDGGFQMLQRTPGGISLFQTPSEHGTHNPGYMVQNQQFPQTQFLASDPTQTTSTLYQNTGFVNYPGSENVNAAPRPDYSPFFRSPSPNNLQFQMNNNPFSPPRSAAGILYNPMMQFQPNFPNRPQYSPQYSAPNQQIQIQSSTPEEKKQKELDKITEGETTNSEEKINTPSKKEDAQSIPFGARIQTQNGQEPQGDFPPQTEVYMRYPVKEAGYATEESLPVQNTTTKTETKAEPSPPRPIFSFFQAPGQFGDPYRNALNAIQRGYSADSSVRNNDKSNSTKQAQPEQIPPRMAFPFSQPALARPIPGYPDSRNPNQPLMRPPSFFQTVESPAADPFDQLAIFPDQYPGPPQMNTRAQETPVLPACTHGQANASVCFEDPEYPKTDVLFALNSDPFLMERFSMPDQQLDGISLVEQDRLEHPESATNYICSSKIRYGFPLRAKDINGKWKVIVNIEKDIGQGRFMQPVRLEVCKGAGDPCNFTQVKTACVQKYNLHRLLSWSPEKGIHNDVFKLPVACSCQLIDAQA